MGHLILIANNLSKQLATEPIQTIVSEKIPQETQDAWQVFVEGPLAEVNKIYEVSFTSTFLMGPRETWTIKVFRGPVLWWKVSVTVIL